MGFGALGSRVKASMEGFWVWGPLGFRAKAALE